MKRVVAVAASGGRDSTALLHATARQAGALGIEVVALHVHHGLMPEADSWLEHVRRQAARLGVRFVAERLQGRPARGDSVEAWARKERYAALARLAHAAGCSLVLLAQHRRDQAETFLIQALRGAGAAGLAAMPRVVQRDGITWARPWLASGRSAIDAYLKRHRLRAVEDPSNSDSRFARARLRRLWPSLSAAFPDADTTLALAAQRAAAEAELVAEVAAADLLAIGARGAGLPVSPWLALSPARRVAALRAWLAWVMPQPVPETLVRRLMDELARTRHARWHAGRDDLVLRKGLLTLGPAAPRRADAPGAARAGGQEDVGTDGPG